MSILNLEIAFILMSMVQEYINWYRMGGFGRGGGGMGGGFGAFGGGRGGMMGGPPSRPPMGMGYGRVIPIFV